MNADNLDTLTDDQLSDVFALEVAGWIFNSSQYGIIWTNRDSRSEGLDLPNFSTDSNAVLPWLEKHAGCEIQRVHQLNGGIVAPQLPLHWRAQLFLGLDHEKDDEPIYAIAVAPTFARAACIALIRAKRYAIAQPG